MLRCYRPRTTGNKPNCFKSTFSIDHSSADSINDDQMMDMYSECSQDQLHFKKMIQMPGSERTVPVKYILTINTNRKYRITALCGLNTGPIFVFVALRIFSVVKLVLKLDGCCLFLAISTFCCYCNSIRLYFRFPT